MSHRPGYHSHFSGGTFGMQKLALASKIDDKYGHELHKRLSPPPHGTPLRVPSVGALGPLHAGRRRPRRSAHDIFDDRLFRELGRGSKKFQQL